MSNLNGWRHYVQAAPEYGMTSFKTQIPVRSSASFILSAAWINEYMNSEIALELVNGWSVPFCGLLFFFLKTLSLSVLCHFLVELSSAAFDDWSCSAISTNYIFQWWPQNQHKATITPPNIDVASLIHFPELVRGQNLTGNPGRLFLDFLVPVILFVGTLALLLAGELLCTHRDRPEQPSASPPRPLPHLTVPEWTSISSHSHPLCTSWELHAQYLDRFHTWTVL